MVEVFHVRWPKVSGVGRANSHKIRLFKAIVSPIFLKNQLQLTIIRVEFDYVIPYI